MNDMTRPTQITSAPASPKYVTPKITVMRDDEVLKAFQMTALEISAAGCWWSSSSWHGKFR